MLKKLIEEIGGSRRLQILIVTIGTFLIFSLFAGRGVFGELAQTITIYWWAIVLGVPFAALIIHFEVKQYSAGIFVIVILLWSLVVSIIETCFFCKTIFLSV